ncbi:MAG TPA: substrate-binding domain-containing protein [Acidobacteriota bacterium]|nr:substrate-binding domain-containing protein [Acidobacteriota bacterium]
MKQIMRKRSCYLGVLILALVLQAAPGCRTDTGKSQESGTVTLILGAYTTPREVYGRSIIPAFQAYWKGKTGQQVEFRESYQASGAQARAVIGGFEADIVALSLSADVDKIVDAGLIKHDWREKPHNGIVSTSIVVMAVRPVDPAVAAEVQNSYPEVQDLWTIEFLGGWPRVIADIFGPQGVYTRVYQDIHKKGR